MGSKEWRQGGREQLVEGRAGGSPFHLKIQTEQHPLGRNSPRYAALLTQKNTVARNPCCSFEHQLSGKALIIGCWIEQACPHALCQRMPHELPHHQQGHFGRNRSLPITRSIGGNDLRQHCTGCQLVGQFRPNPNDGLGPPNMCRLEGQMYQGREPPQQEDRNPRSAARTVWSAQAESLA